MLHIPVCGVDRFLILDLKWNQNAQGLEHGLSDGRILLRMSLWHVWLKGAAFCQ